MAFRKITDADMSGKGNVGKADTPGYSTAEMQRVMDELPREVIAPIFNELVDALEANTAGGTMGASVPEHLPSGTENNVQSILDALDTKLQEHEDRTDNPHSVQAEQVPITVPGSLPSSTAKNVQAVADALDTKLQAHESRTDNPHGVKGTQVPVTVPANLPSGTAANVQAVADALDTKLQAHESRTDNPHGVKGTQVPVTVPANLPSSTAANVQAVADALDTKLQAHESRADNPHGLTAAQLDVYTKKETEQEITRYIEVIGAADMQAAVYDPGLRKTDIFAITDDLDTRLQGVEGINSIAPLTVSTAPTANGVCSLALGNEAKANYYSVAVGDNAKNTVDHEVAIGYKARTNAYGAVAIGFNANATKSMSVALGSDSTADEANTVSVGGTLATRRIVKVKDPTAAQDAATKNYVDTTIDSARSSISTDIDNVIMDLPYVYAATLLLDNWEELEDTSSGYVYTQQAQLASETSAAPSVTEDSIFLTPCYFTPTGVQATDESLSEALAIINAGYTTSGSGTVTVLAAEKPACDITVKWTIQA